MEQTPDAEFAEWIKAYSGGVLKEGVPVKIVLSQDVESDALTEMSQEQLNALFSFSPELKGQVRFTKEGILEFFPEQKSLKHGSKYSVTFNLGRIVHVKKKSMEKFRFTLVTQPKSAMLSLDGIAISALSPDVAEVSGRIIFSGEVSCGEAETMLALKGNTQARIEVEQVENSDIIPFKITNIPLKEETETLALVFDGKSHGFQECQTEIIEIPAKSGFNILDVMHFDGKSPYVEIRFSRPLDTSLDYDGLFELSGAGRNYLSVRDNIVKIYYESIGMGDLELCVSPGIRSFDGRKLEVPFKKKFEGQSLKPAVRLEMEGNIVPDADCCILPFSAVNLSAIDLSVIKIYENNILNFLQDNDFEEDNQLRRFGRLVCKKTVKLDNGSGIDLNEWQRFAIDLSGLIKQDSGAIYRVRLSFRREYSLYGSGAGLPDEKISSGDMVVIQPDGNGLSEEEELVWDEPSPYYYESFYDWSLYDWKESDNPLHPSYYMQSDRFPSINLYSSRLGLLSKSSGNDNLWVAINDLITTEPVASTVVTVYNYQLQKIGEGKTGRDGITEIRLSGKPFAVTAGRGDKVEAYLKVVDGKENSLSRFDTGGQKVEKGMKAFIYGERGVWRPGDTLHVTLVADDRDNVLPDNHPVTMELYTPQGQFYTKIISKEGMNGFHSFAIPTAKDDPTGTWNAYFKIGGSTFYKPLMIEDIRPNRLKMKLDAGSDILQGGKIEGFDLQAAWLSGAVAAGLKSSVELSLSSAGKSFKGYENYVFSDPAGSDFTGGVSVLFEKVLDSRGRTHADVLLPEYRAAPGMMRANILTKIEEPGGDRSVTASSLLFSPYDAYVGVENPGSEDFIETDKDHVFHVVVLDKNGKPLKNRKLEYKIYKMEWSWWWESDPARIRSYVNGTAAAVHSSGTVVSGSSAAEIPFRVDYPEWGRYLVYVKDLAGGHASGITVLVDWPSYRGRSSKSDPNAVTMLSFSTDKKEYLPGETATLFIPAANEGLALVSVENGTRVITSDWVKTSGKEDTPYKFTVTEDMAPNFYLHVTLLQKYGNTSNDLPVRMYGVIPVLVKNEKSRLHPQIKMPDNVRPLEEFSIRVSEKDNRPMTYTLAIVDEGLLDLTAFRTPDPWSAIYAREALGVKTWDMYGNVAGANAGKFASMFSVGGDMTIDRSARQDNRFNPVVRFLGPFTLNGKENVHKVTLPMYVGSVRVMLVAGQDGSYGNVEKTVPVKTPLMILSSLPSALGHGEEVALPVNVFAMEDNVKDVKVSVEVSGSAELVSASSKTLNFSEKGDKLVKFRLKALPEDGNAEVKVTAFSSGYRAEETITLPVRNPALPVTETKRLLIEKGGTAELEYEAFRHVPGSYAILELAGFPTLDINGCFSFMKDYRYDCTEQISSRGIALLALRPLLSEDKAVQVDRLIPELLSSLYARQLPDGGFAYWPGQASADEWVTSMAGQFLQSAATSGFDVSRGVFSAWLNFQKRCVRNYRTAAGNSCFSLVQAYRLYTLALASSPEVGAMNRLKEDKEMSPAASWRLAAAYALAGKKDIAASMVASLKSEVRDKTADGLTYCSPGRDKAMILETMVLVDDIYGAMRLSGNLAEELAASGGFTTQTGAFASVALGRLSEKLNKGVIDVHISQTEGEQSENLKSANPVVEYELNTEKGKVKVKNSSDGPLYAALSVKRIPLLGKTVPAHSSGLKLNVSWRDIQGNPINPYNLSLGTEFRADISVVNLSATEDYENLALTFPVVSGWEIFNERVFGNRALQTESEYAYKDLRDDKAVYYFSLPAGTSKRFSVRLRAAYEGEFVLPSAVSEDMYDPSVSAGTGSEGMVIVNE